MGQIISIMNQKGGVGKTTTAINVCACLARAGMKVLLVDLDPQCNATSGLNQKAVSAHPLVADVSWTEAVVSTKIPNFLLLPGCRSYRQVSKLHDGSAVPSERLQEMLTGILNSFDYVLLDLPPAVSPLSETAVKMASLVLIPIQCEFFAMDGVVKMTSMIPADKWLSCGILMTMADVTLELTKEVEAEIREHFGDIVYRTFIPRDVSIAEASGYGVPVIEYAPRSRSARAYIELTMEILENEQE
ncbi:MAG: ParA family protein [Thermoguttaceae bacterium]|nr:ParA family protein [Thermoguttaceae bacterium]